MEARRAARVRGRLLQILALSLGHFVVAMAVAILAEGTDLDQLRSRSRLSRAAGVVSDVLWGPHDALLRSLPSGSVTRPGVVPGVLVASSLFWGLALYAALAAKRAIRREPTR